MKTGITSLIINDKFICFRENTQLKPNSVINIPYQTYMVFNFLLLAHLQQFVIKSLWNLPSHKSIIWTFSRYIKTECVKSIADILEQQRHE